VRRLPQPHCRLCRLGLNHPSCGLACADALETLLAAHGQKICALIVEPRVQGAAGIIVQPAGYLRRLWEICQTHDVLFIADEVATGFGRTGSLFACDLEGITPDLMCLGKGLTGGVLPLSATLASDQVYEAFLGRFEEFKTFFHGHTYTGNPIACAAALASLELMRAGGMVASLAPRIEQLGKGLKEIARRSHVVEVRQQGLMAGIELVRDKTTGRAYDPEQRMGHRVIMACRPQGVIIRPLGDTVVLMPPLASSAEEIDLLLAAVDKAIAQVTED
jgi:adenosylmethionine-8-amino-7-oxononanoate aminotransferase